MAEDLMRYDLLAQEALRGVVRQALRRVERLGFPGEHHFYIAFLTQAPGVQLSERLRQRYPAEMTIVLQHQFWNLAVREDEFQVELSFNDIPEKLVIPFRAVKGFLDPSVQFGLQFETVSEEAAALQAEGLAPKEAPIPLKRPEPEPKAAESSENTPKIVSLDAFRKK
ncbi:MAG: ClpXP protease specificity-enhancing factor SspB [Hyphomicrobiales bacterium]